MHESRSKTILQRSAALALALLLAVLASVQPVWAAPEEGRRLIPSGQAVGIKLFADGVLVVSVSDLEGARGSPARDCGLREGDLLVQIDGQEIRSTEQLQGYLQQRRDAPVSLTVQRGDKTWEQETAAVLCDDGVYRLGVWIRDSMAGIGTLTFYDPDTGLYGALGHGITDVDTHVLMPLGDGSIMETTVRAVKKGRRGEPGELKGDFSVQRDVGTVRANTAAGIFGVMSDGGFVPEGEALPVAGAGEVHTGPATILATVSGGRTESYQVEIVKLSPQQPDMRNLLLRVTDRRLLETTGGIVQGMSGSPIVQDGYLVGAVTHVFINDPTQGYGILMENMLAMAG